MIEQHETLGRVAANHPHSTQVFLRHGLDFCCGGRQPLDEACRAAGLDPAVIIAEIAKETAGPSEHRWDGRPLDELVEHIVTRYHETLRRDLPVLLGAAQKVERVHGAKPSCPLGLAAALEKLSTELLPHMDKEERVLFPAIRAGTRGAPIHNPIRMMMAEHDEHGVVLRLVRQLATDFVPPPPACATWRALYLGLAKLEEELMEHIHLENNILFPSALNADSATHEA